jgi:hypothetical protein
VDNLWHTPLECSNYALYYPLPSSHKRYFSIKRNQIFYKHRTNDPYISGDSIARLTDYHAYGRSKKNSISITKLEEADSIFVPGELLLEFIQKYGSSIKARTLVTGNSDRNFTDEVILPPSIQLWLCQNSAMPTKLGVATLPIGIENISLGRTGFSYYYEKHYQDADSTVVLVPPMSPTNSIRFKIVAEAMGRPDVFHVHRHLLPEKEYFSLVRSYRFIMCCEGNGFENHRIWETLYQGSFPVMLNSAWANSLKYLNLPILLINDLSEVTADLLKEFEVRHKDFDPSNTAQLWTPFWKSIILNAIVGPPQS